ncbi:MAG: DUF4488 domain-containing protein [Bacteroidaceae bacterium]|nr:DUF4488 domain-containing protein [Bacteroidaceae bacterium]
MKKFMFLLTVILLLGVRTGYTQEAKTGPKAGPLVGMWQYVEEVTTAEGDKAYIGKQIFKTITEDNTYFVILGVNFPIKEANWEESKTSTLAFITQQGEIEMKEDNTYLEYINNHYLDKSLNNTISNLRYRFSEENKNILYVEYNLSGTDNDNWISEIWLRVIPYGAK